MRKLFIIGIGFLSTLLIVATVYSGEKLAYKLYLKSGTVIECDIFWEDRGDFILIQKSHGTIGYWKSEVDLIRTFGQSSATEIAKRYEERLKHRELISRPRIVTPEQERNMRERERERPKIDRPARLTRRDLEEMFKFAPTAAELRMRGVQGDTREEKIARYLRAQAIREHEASLEREREEKIEELERNPEYYFYEKNQQRAERGKRVEHNTGAVGTRDGTFYAPTGDGGFINTRTGEIIN